MKAMINILELSIAADFDFDTLRGALSHALQVDVDQVIDDDEYWLRPLEQRAELVGFYVARANGNYPVLLTAHCAADVYGEALGDVAIRMAAHLGVCVAVGDFIHDVELATGRFIVYSPDGSRRFGYESADGEGFDVQFFE
jgi:hypothetical protein